MERWKDRDRQKTEGMRKAETERGLRSTLLAEIIRSQQRRDSSISTVFIDGH